MKLLLKRLAQLIGFLALVLVLAVAALHWYQPKVPLVVLPPPKPVSGAAVFYNQAFAAMPKLSEEEEKLLSTKSDQPLDTAKATELLAKLEPSLKLLEQGAREKGCEWGLNLNLGPAIRMPHIPKALSLEKALKMQARLHLENGNAPAAVDDLLLSFQFACHLGEPELLISNLVQISADKIAIDFAARHLPQFDQASLQKLSEGIAALPASHSMREVVAMENKIMCAYLRHEIANEATRRSREPWFIRVIEWCHPRITLPMEFPALEVSKTMIRMPTMILFGWVDELERYYYELDALLDLPYAEAKPKIAACEKRMEDKKTSNPIAAITALAVNGLRPKEVQMEAMWKILQTALDAQIHNPSSVREELAKLRDPYDGGPIEMRDVPGGVELQLKSDPDKKPMTLMVGLAGK